MIAKLSGYGGAAVGVLQRDAVIFTSYRLSFLAQLASTLFSIVLFYYISRLVTVDQFTSPDQYFAFAVIGVVTLEVVNTAAVLVPTALRGELVMGTFERLVLSPFGAVASAASMMLFPFAWVVTKTTIALAIATVAFDLPIQWPGAALAVPVAVLGALSFAPFGLLVTAVVLVMKQALGMTTWIVAALSIVAGFYFPVTLLPDWIEWFSEVQPFTPTIELMRSTLVGIDMSESAWLAVAKLVGFATVLTPIALWVLAKAVHASRRRGTIIEY
jgi:ABC-2 type transport system permease protein